MANKIMSDGWHMIAGHRVYVEGGLARHPDFYGSLYVWNKELRVYNNILPCKPGRIRYYHRVGKLIAK